MKPKQFLMAGGGLLTAVGLVGFIGVIGPAPESSIFGKYWWFGHTENWAHLLLGMTALGSAYTLNPKQQEATTLLISAISLLVGLLGFALGEDLWGANLQNPLDNLLHLALGAWGLWAWGNRKKSALPLQGKLTGV